MIRAIHLAAVAFLLNLVGCGTGYQKSGGEWCYVTIDTGTGRNAAPLNADDETFVVLDDKDYAKDSTSVFYRGERIKKADPGTFRLLDEPYFSRDEKNVFLLGHTVIGADPDTFVLIDAPYGRDASRIYCGTVPMEVENMEGFTVVTHNSRWEIDYGKETFVQRYGDSFADLEVSHEQPAVVSNAWARDGVAYYYAPGKVVDADYDSFTVIDECSARDKNNSYWRARIRPAD